MKLYIANYEPNRIGGGWAFSQNLASGIETVSYDEADTYFITGASMVQRDDVRKAKDEGKKIVLRVDNAIRNSRNRNTGMTRMLDFATWADLVVYQSEWSKNYLKPFLKKDGPVILNGVDIDVFKPRDIADENCVLYSRFNRDETKNFEVARYWFSQYALKNPKAHLIIVGQFSPELSEGNFDFYNGERFIYLGTIDKGTMANIYQQAGQYLYTYFNDCCSNTLIEALVSGCEIVGDPYYLRTGGANEIIKLFKSVDFDKARRFFSKERMCLQYREELEKC